MHGAFTTTPPGMCEHTRDCKQLFVAMFSFAVFQNVLHKQTTYKQ